MLVEPTMAWREVLGITGIEAESMAALLAMAAVAAANTTGCTYVGFSYFPGDHIKY